LVFGVRLVSKHQGCSNFPFAKVVRLGSALAFSRPDALAPEFRVIREARLHLFSAGLPARL